jgi:hypothetical protein
MASDTAKACTFFAARPRLSYHRADSGGRPSLNLCLKCGRLYDGELTRCPRDGEELLPYEATVHDGEEVADVVLGRILGIGPCGKIVEGIEVAGGRRVVVRLLGEDLLVDKAATDTLLRHLQQAKAFTHPGASSSSAMPSKANASRICSPA